MFRDIAARQTRAPLCVFDVEVLTLNALVIVNPVALGTFVVTLEARLLQYIAVQEAYSDEDCTIHSILMHLKHANDKINLFKDRQEAQMRDILLTSLFFIGPTRALLSK